MMPIQSHLTGTFISCKVFGSYMAVNSYGAIVNISSVVGYNSGPVLAYGFQRLGLLILPQLYQLNGPRQRSL